MLYKKTNQLDQCQLKFSSEEKGVFEGYASVFGSVDQVGDTIEKGAFSESLESGRAIKMFVNHQQHEVPVGDWLHLEEDGHGLKSVGKIDLNHKDGMTVYSALRRGAMDGESIGFTMKEGDFVEKDTGRVIKNMKLMEISVVNFPCEGGAVISGVKADADMLLLKNLSDCERYLRDAFGLSKSLAKTLVSQIRNCARCDAELELESKGDNEAALAALRQIRERLNTRK
jgi:HK97 family phage prohead protease